jgi:hypothetical protein
MSHKLPQYYKLGNLIEKTIAIITLGYGHSIAEYVARKLGYSTCGCETRKEWLNTLFVKQDIKF